MSDAQPIPPAPERSCFSKTRYSSEVVAKSAALKCWRERRVNLRAYPCDVCGGYHLTSRGAAPVMKAGWRFPKKSTRQIAREQRERKRGRR